MNNKNQMNGLYPIIRRVRRPLLPVDVLPDGQPAGAKPIDVPKSTGAASETNDAAESRKETNAEADAIEKAE
jgi:hypothetical protein